MTAYKSLAGGFLSAGPSLKSSKIFEDFREGL
jgi:hypothetical protein